ncbi:hypothetical protein, partial [Paenibacillus endophyticus]|uniref:hypothetical protein n=1 Tax=Paenibacillus endophyticus TaxID=1294268 RepID=UPI0039F09209
TITGILHLRRLPMERSPLFNQHLVATITGILTHLGLPEHHLSFSNQLPAASNPHPNKPRKLPNGNRTL